LYEDLQLLRSILYQSNGLVEPVHVLLLLVVVVVDPMRIANINFALFTVSSYT